MENLTKREYFAAQLLQGLLASNNHGPYLTTVQDAVRVADLLIAELNTSEVPESKPKGPLYDPMY